MDQELLKLLVEKTTVVDEKGEPLVVYHGSGTNIEEFDPDLTGKGWDQLGSGFYFTTDKSQAMGYMTKTMDGKPRKLGGEDSPTLIRAHLELVNPIEVTGETLRDAKYNVTEKQAARIILNSPDIMDPDTSPFRDWIDNFYEIGPEKNMVNEVAPHYVGQTFLQLENDFFPGQSTEFRTQAHAVTRYDGVVKRFDNGVIHYVAWFPEQIKILGGE